MKKEWVREKNKNRDNESKIKKEEAYKIIDSIKLATDEQKSRLKKIVDGDYHYVYLPPTSLVFYNVFERDDIDKDLLKICEDLAAIMYEAYEIDKTNYERYLDSNPMEFDGDIIITDPCYVMKDNDWCTKEIEDCVHKCMYRDTIFGDWSCTTFDENNKPIGEFCADAGMVAVMDLNEVLEYNPAFTVYIERKWTTTVIKDFKGTVQFVVNEVHFEYEGRIQTDYEVEVVGKGINKKTNKPINFIGKQTGL